METNKRILEHPLVTRVKSMLNPPLSPVLTIKDLLQPSHGTLSKHRAFMKYASELNNYTLE